MNYKFCSRTIAAGILIVASFGASAAPKVGEVPPDKVGLNLEKQAVLLTGYQDKAIVLSFWATWCHYCMKELPILYNIQKKVGKEHLQVIAVNTESRSVFRKAAETLANLDLLFANDEDENAQDAYGVKGIPHMVIIGRDGRIVAVYRGYNESSLPGIASDINKALSASQ